MQGCRARDWAVREAGLGCSSAEASASPRQSSGAGMVPRAVAHSGGRVRPLSPIPLSCRPFLEMGDPREEARPGAKQFSSIQIQAHRRFSCE